MPHEAKILPPPWRGPEAGGGPSPLRWWCAAALCGSSARTSRRGEAQSQPAPTTAQLRKGCGTADVDQHARLCIAAGFFEGSGCLDVHLQIRTFLHPAAPQITLLVLVNACILLALGQGRPGTGAALWASLFQRAMLQRAPCWCYIFHGPCSATVTWTKWASSGGRIRGFLKTRTWTAFSSNMTCPPTWRSQWNQGMCGCGFNDARFEIHHRRDIHLLHFSHAQMIQHLVLKRQAIFSLAKELIKQLSSVWGQVGHLHRQLAAPLMQLLPKLPAARKWYASVQLDSVNGFPFESKNSNHDLFHSIYNDRKGTTL